MARPKGSRSADYAARRAALLERIGAHLAEVYPARPSMRDLAEAAGVRQPTLRHYFGSREAVLVAHLQHFGSLGTPYLAQLQRRGQDLRASLTEAAEFIATGLTLEGLAAAQAAALSEGLATAETGSAYIAHVLEPLIDAVRMRLDAHMAAGEMRAADTRLAALQLVSPLFVAALHQQHLNGRQTHPLDMTALAGEVAASVARAYGPETTTPGR